MRYCGLDYKWNLTELYQTEVHVFFLHYNYVRIWYSMANICKSIFNICVLIKKL